MELPLLSKKTQGCRAPPLLFATISVENDNGVSSSMSKRANSSDMDKHAIKVATWPMRRKWNGNFVEQGNPQGVF